MSSVITFQEKPLLAYRVIEDGEPSIVRATTMESAIEICRAEYLREPKLEIEELGDNYFEDAETDFYFSDILQSCELLGVLRN